MKPAYRPHTFVRLRTTRELVWIARAIPVDVNGVIVAYCYLLGSGERMACGSDLIPA